jgi:phosphinothricin acetyltransferase
VATARPEPGAGEPDPGADELDTVRGSHHGAALARPASAARRSPAPARYRRTVPNTPPTTPPTTRPTSSPSTPPLTLRDAAPADAAACAALYAPYVTGTAVSFEDVPPSPAEMARRIDAYGASHAWLVAELDGALVGYAYGSPYRPRPAYRWTAETSVYLGLDAPRRTGAGRALYTALLERLAARGYRQVITGIALPNDASVGLHRALGFTEVGVERQVGWKLGAWHDLLRMQRSLAPDDEAAGEPR